MCLLVIFFVALEGGVIGVVLRYLNPASPDVAMINTLDSWLNFFLAVLFGILNLVFISPTMRPSQNRHNKINLSRGGFKTKKVAWRTTNKVRVDPEASP